MNDKGNSKEHTQLEIYKAIGNININLVSDLKVIIHLLIIIASILVVPYIGWWSILFGIILFAYTIWEAYIHDQLIQK